MHSTGYSVQMRPFPNRGVHRKNREDSCSDEILCSVCDLWCLGPAQYSDHANGSRHMKKKNEINSLEILNRIPSIRTANVSNGAAHCTICDVSLTSLATAVMHVNGAKHQKAVEASGKSEMKTSDGIGRSQNDEAPSKINDSVNSLTELSVNSASLNAMSANGTSENITSTLTHSSISDKPSSKTVSNLNPPLVTTSANSPQEQSTIDNLYCDACKISVNSKSQMAEHSASAKHMTKVRPPVRFTPYHREKPI